MELYLIIWEPVGIIWHASQQWYEDQRKRSMDIGIIYTTEQFTTSCSFSL